MISQILLIVLLGYFEDETCLVFSDNFPSLLCKQATIELQNFKSWCNFNELTINPTKSSLLVVPPKINKPKYDLNVIYNDINTNNSTTAKYLGVMIDDQLYPNLLK